MVDDAIKHAMSWFQIHADQRIRLMNFYVILLAGSLAIIGSAVNERNYKIQILIGISMCVITFAFKNLDRRTALLIKRGEIAIDAMEKLISDHIKSEEIRIIRSLSERNAIPTYRSSFNVIFLLGLAIGVIVASNGISTYFRI